MTGVVSKATTALHPEALAREVVEGRAPAGSIGEKGDPVSVSALAARAGRS